MDEEIFSRAFEYVRGLSGSDAGGHDHYHALRVHNAAAAICSAEGGDSDVVRLAAILHDADDPKMFSTSNNANARRFMDSEGIPEDVREKVCGIISNLSFAGTGSRVPDSLEGKIVQDADRLDAIGAIGVARAFAYGGSRGRAMHVPGEPPRTGMGEAEYRSAAGTTVNHFREKLLLLKDLMNTEAGRRAAESRHAYLENFLEEFLAEWDGTRRRCGFGRPECGIRRINADSVTVFRFPFTQSTKP